MGILIVSFANLFGALNPKVVADALDMVLDSLRLARLSTDMPVQDVIISSMTQNLFIFGLVILGLALLQGFFMYWMRQTIIVMSRLIEYDLRKDIFAHYTTMDLSFFRGQKTGDLMSRLTEDVSKVRNFLGPALLYGINMFTLLVFVIGSMLYENVQLTLYCLLPLPLLSFSIYKVSSIIHTQSSKIQKQLAQITDISQEVYNGIRILKSFAREENIGDYFDRNIDDYKEKSLHLAKTNALFFPLMLFFIGISTIITVYFGGREVMAGNITPGTIAQFVIYVNMLTWPVTSIGWISSIIQQASVSNERLNEFLETKSEIPDDGTLTDITNGKIEFKEVDFTYQNTGIQAINGMSFLIRPGQKVAVIGKTGSGKTTMADLVLRLFDADSGQILVDDSDIKDYKIESLRDQVAYVPQDVFLFSDTISNNVRIVDETLEDDQIQKYTGYAMIHDELSGLPEGYDTIIGERGVTLSGGQKQRLSIARALVKDAKIVIMDDCLSAVDANTEIAISSHLKDALQDATALIITHRINPELYYDQIIVIDDGAVVVQGTHEELMMSNDYYRQMYEKSFAVEEG